MRYVIWVLLAVFAACSAEPAATDPGTPTPSLVTSEWLKGNLDNLVVVDTQSTRELYEKGHVDGAVHLVVTTLRDEKKNLAAVAVLEKKLGDLGIRGDSHVVAYDETNGRNATYLWYALTQLGHTRVSVLDGTMAGLKDVLVTGPPPTVEAQSYKAFRQPENVVDTAWILANRETVHLLDTRPVEQYTGTKPKKGYRTGHMPGTHHFHRSLFLNDDGTFVSAEEAKAIASKLPRDKPIVIFCNTLHDGAHVYFQLTRAGLTNLKAWDSGLRDYMADESSALKLGSQP